VDKKVLTAVAVGALVVAVVVTAVIVYYAVKVHGHGKIKTVGAGVFSDAGCTQPVGEVDWGVIPQGGSSAVTLYVKNTGNSNVTLSLSTEAWSPSTAQQYLTLSWDYAGVWLLPNQAVKVVLTLNVAQNATGFTDFDFNSVITAQG
jgi:hypothetical protein